jgi:type III restriction enzyme
MDTPATVHAINVLTVVANESYKDFVAGLQKDISETLSDRPRLANEAYFNGKVLQTAAGEVPVTPPMAKQIYRYLVKNDYTTDDDRVSDAYHAAKQAGTVAELPDELQPHAEAVFKLIDSVFSDAQLPTPSDDRAGRINKLNANFQKKEFQDLWRRINHKAAYTVHFDSAELVKKCIAALNKELKVQPLRYTVVSGRQAEQIDADELKRGDGFRVDETRVDKHRASVHSAVRYDLIGKLAGATVLTRATVSQILVDLEKPVFAQFKSNPEGFLAEATRLIREQKATAVVEHLSYNLLDEDWGTDIFTVAQTKVDFERAVGRKDGSGAVVPLAKHIYDYVLIDSNSSVERKFTADLDTSAEVVVYAKLPRGFAIPTPVGDYNPDWAIAFKDGSVKHIYFVAETKGSMSSMELRDIEKSKIECARKLFADLNKRFAPEQVTYDVVDSFDKLRELVA